MCGTLQCQMGNRNPVQPGNGPVNATVTRISFDGKELECKLVAFLSHDCTSIQKKDPFGMEGVFDTFSWMIEIESEGKAFCIMRTLSSFASLRVV